MRTNEIYNTFGIPCTARLLVGYDSKETLLSLLQEYGNERLFHVGGGSNLLFLHPYFPGIVIHNDIHSIQLLSQNSDDVFLRVGGGLSWDRFVAYTLNHGWYGLENLSFIPGEVGASAVQNVGAYGVEVGEFIHEVECVNLHTLQTRIFTHDELSYAYRHSLFKTPQHRGQWAVLYVVYRLSTHFQPRMQYGGILAEIQRSGLHPENITATQLRDVIISIRKQKLPDPEVQGSAGSFFKNPVISLSQFHQLQSKFPNLPYYYFSPSEVKVPAGWLIEQCGWKGRSLGPAAVHHSQALVLVNLGDATGQDILALCHAIQHDVYERFAIQLQPEVNFIE